MRRKDFKGRCEKRSLSKCEYICKTYDPVQSAYAVALEHNDGIKAFKCNVEIGVTDDVVYTSDFVCTKKNGAIMVRECVPRKLIGRPMTARLLDLSKDYWLKKGVKDWGIVVDEEK